MDFFIKRRATLPILRVEVNKDGRNDFHHNQNLSDISNVYVSFIDYYRMLSTVRRGFVNTRVSTVAYRYAYNENTNITTIITANLI